MQFSPYMLVLWGWVSFKVHFLIEDISLLKSWRHLYQFLPLPLNITFVFLLLIFFNIVAKSKLRWNFLKIAFWKAIDCILVVPHPTWKPLPNACHPDDLFFKYVLNIVSCWEVIKGGDGQGELGWWEEFELFKVVGTMLGVGYTKGKGKTCWQS